MLRRRACSRSLAISFRGGQHRGENPLGVIFQVLFDQSGQQNLVFRQAGFPTVFAAVNQKGGEPSRRLSSRLLTRSMPSSDGTPFPTTVRMASTISICSGRNVFAASREMSPSAMYAATRKRVKVHS